MYTSVTNYTTTHFSPVIIEAELGRIKSPKSVEDLSAESRTVKVASAVNEVTAGNNMDKHQLEITLKIPNYRPFFLVIRRSYIISIRGIQQHCAVDLSFK
jgi:E3 ubiquitin-protein ligase listerin